jgi:hypothetical protein
MRHQQVNFKKECAPFINYVQYLLARHIKAELGCEVPKLGLREYIFSGLVQSMQQR